MRYFTFDELLHSNIAEQNYIDNLPPKSERAKVFCNLLVIVDNLLEPIREKFAVPMIITSGYRCEKLNKLLGGKKSSQHMKGEAVDFYFKGFSKKEMVEAFFEIAETFNFDQLICYRKRGFIHISYSRTKNRHQSFII